jgi:hypothetical protein
MDNPLLQRATTQQQHTLCRGEAPVAIGVLMPFGIVLVRVAVGLAFVRTVRLTALRQNWRTPRLPGSATG